MKFINLFTFSKKDKNEKHRVDEGSFSDFFLNAPEKSKKEIIIKAAERANEEQRKIFSKPHTSVK